MLLVKEIVQQNTQLLKYKINDLDVNCKVMEGLMAVYKISYYELLFSGVNVRASTIPSSAYSEKLSKK